MRHIGFLVIIFMAVITGCNFNIYKYNTKEIIGFWATNSNENVDFISKKNGVVEYIEYTSNYDYYIKGNDLFINEKGHLIIKYEIKLLNNDSLHIKPSGGHLIKLAKRKI